MRVVGLAAAFNQLANGIAAGQVEAGQRGLITPVTDRSFFPRLLGSGIAFRERPEVNEGLLWFVSSAFIVHLYRVRCTPETMREGTIFRESRAGLPGSTRG